ncbi:MAG: hypothetical protein QOF28_769, partial [Actinomycetota bacterium]|nr:hypothetical protein [Actinomycetota bacterium]
MALDFGVLGPIEVRRDGRQISIGGRQQRRVLATLIADAGRVVSIERLVDAVWPDGAPDGARRTVMTYISRLRLALGDAHVATQDPGYRFATADESIDAVRFERLVARAAYSPPTESITLIETALGLWRGEAFGEFSTDWWALPHAARLHELRLVATEQRAESLLTVGDDRVVPELEALIAAYPLRERFVGQLMRAYDLSGRQADALRTYNAYRSGLAEQTGLDPSATLRQLEAEILSGRISTEDSTRIRRGYVLGDVLGAGAYGTVYRSAQPGVGREVAVKVIRSELADSPGFVGRFEAEAQLVAHLEHPHVVPLYDFWREPGGAYLVFRLLRGGSCRDLLTRDGALSFDRVDRLVAEVGDALQAAHAAGVVHRDVKAANVLFDEAGNAYLTDFGIAARASRRAGRSNVRGLLPTEPRDDQYSFAAMIWELLAGVPPFDAASTAAVLNGMALRPVGPLPAHCADVADGLTAVLQRATATDPADRFDDISHLLAAWRSARRARDVRVDALAVARQEADRHQPAGLLLPRRALANPYIGLRSFGEADARHFHGRAALTARLVTTVLDHRFVTVVGASGSGKSSLLFAGLVPRLREAGVRVCSMVPGDDPLAHLELALRAVAVEEFDSGGVAEMVGAVAAQQRSRLVVVIDQLEELWTLTDATTREQLLEGVAAIAAGADDTDIGIVVTIRADFFDRPLGHLTLGPIVGSNTWAVTPMSTAELHEAVIAPAAALGIGFEPGLDQAIIADVAGQPASLPLLQFTLADLFERRADVITRAAYESIGGIAGAIATRAEQQFGTLDERGQDAARRLFLRLVVPGDGSEDTRRRARHGELAADAVAVAERFEAARLLVADRDVATREPTVEIAHESLLRSWPRLRGWLAEDRVLLHQLQHVGSAASEWSLAGRPESELYRGSRLDAAERSMATRPAQFTDLEREFLIASRRATDAAAHRQQRARRRLRVGFAATSVALAVALAASGVAFMQRRNADTQANAADVARLVSLSQSLTGTRRDVSLLLAVEAARRSPGAATTSALLAAVSSDPSFLGELRTGTQAGGDLVYGPDGRSLFANPRRPGAAPVRIDLTSGHVDQLAVAGLDRETAVRAFVPVDEQSALVALADDGGGVHPVELVDLGDGSIRRQSSFVGVGMNVSL